MDKVSNPLYFKEVEKQDIIRKNIKLKNEQLLNDEIKRFENIRSINHNTF